MKLLIHIMGLLACLSACVTPAPPPTKKADGLAAMNIMNIMTGQAALIPGSKLRLKYNGVMHVEAVDTSTARAGNEPSSTCDSLLLLAVYKGRRMLGEAELVQSKRIYIASEKIYQVTIKEATNERAVLFVEEIKQLPDSSEVISDR